MLWNDLATVNDLVLVCGADNILLVARKEKQRLIQFLLGLNDTFSPVRSNLLMRQLLPTVSMAYSFLLQEEN